MNPLFEETFWGFFSGEALVVGAAIGYFAKVPTKVIAGIMAFGSGVLISALSFELMAEAFEQAGMTAMGDVMTLNAIAEEINDQSDSCMLLSKQIVQMAEDFDLDGIQKLTDK